MTPPPVPLFVLDSGALIALERDDARAFARLAEASRWGHLVAVPALVVMAAYRSAARTHRLDQILRKIGCELPLTVADARLIPGARSRAGVDSDADVSVVLEAMKVPGSRILTGDREDILAVIEAAGATGRVPVLTV
jgi:hypothetical protein